MATDPYASYASPVSAPTQGGGDPYSSYASPVGAPIKGGQDPYAGASSPVPSSKPVSHLGHIGLGVRDVMEGIGSVADMIDNPITSVENAATGGHQSLDAGSALADSLADRIGLPSGDNNVQDRIVGSINRGAAAGLATGGVAGLARGAGGVLGSVAKIVASSPLMDTVSGATSGASSQVAAENGAGPYGQLLAGLAGGIAPSGVHIAAHAAGIHIPNAPAFVSELFNQRGVDTTPAADPRTQPLQNRGMSPEDLEQYHQTLANGTPDQINQFFANSKMSNPGSDAVNQWVAHRDGSTMAGAPTPDPAFYQNTIDSAVAEGHRQGVEDHVNNITQDWKNAPQYNVMNSSDHVDGADPRALGSYQPDGSVNVFADRIKNSADANALVYHEGLGHHGLATVFGSNLDSVISTLLDKDIGSLGKDTAAFQKQDPAAYDGNRIRAAEEVLAQQSEKGQIKQSTSDALNSVIRRFGRKMGMNIGFNDADVQSILAMAHDAVINGRTVKDNGFSVGAPKTPLNLSSIDGQNKFMYTGPKAATFDPEHATAMTASDGVQRNEISDQGAKLKELPPENGAAKLGDIIDHPELFKQYPHLKDQPVLHTQLEGLDGAYSPKTKVMYVNSMSDLATKLSTILHETQHAIQDHEQYPGMTDEAAGKELTLDEYNNHPIEKEAFGTEDRLHMSDAERAANQSKFMRRPDSNNIRNLISNTQPDELEAIRQHGMEEHQSQIDYHTRDLDDLMHFLDKNKDLLTKYDSILERGEQNPHYAEVMDAIRLVKNGDIRGNLYDSLDGRNNGRYVRLSGLSKLALEIEETVNKHITDLNGLIDSKSPSAILEHLPIWTKNKLGMTLEKGSSHLREDFGLSPDTNKFMRRPLTEDPKDIAEEMYNHLAEGYTPRPRSWEDAQAAALDRGINPGNVRDIRGVGALDKRLFQYDQNAHALNTELSGYADKLNSGQALTGEEHARSIEAIAEAMYVRGRIDNDASQVGRGLNAMKAIQYSRSNLSKLHEALTASESGLEGLAEGDNLDKFLKQYGGLTKSNNPKGAAMMIKQLNKPNWEDYIITLHNNMMLSGLSTHVKAPQDMMIGIGRDLLDSMGALPISMAKDALRSLGMDIKPGIHPAEIAGRLYGVLKAGFDSSTYKDTVTTFMNKGINPTGIGGKQSARIPGISRVTDLISAQDAFFRSFATNMHLYGLAARDTVETMRANKTPLKWDQIMSGMSTRAHMPSGGLLKGAQDAANQTLLLNKNAATEAIDRFKNSARGDQPLKRFFAFTTNFMAPFIRVEANSLWTRSIRRSPLAVLDKQTMADLKSGGPAADIAMSRIIMGTASIAATWAAGNKLKGPISTWAAQLTGHKDLTGQGPDSPAKRAALEATGWRPDAVHENGQYNTGNKLAMSLNPFDQHNSTATMVNDMHEAWDKGQKESAMTGLKLAWMTTMKQMADQSWISDIAPVVDAATASTAQGESKWSRLLSNEAGTMMPNLTSQYARITDQNQPQTEVPHNIHQSVVNTLQSDIPGLREQLPTHNTPFGDPVQSGASGFGQHGFFPQDNRLTGGNHVDETNDPAKQEIARLDSITNQPMVSPVLRTIHLDGQDDPKVLNNKELADYQHLAGISIIQNVQSAMNDPSWQTMSDLDKARMVRQISADTKKAAREHLFGNQSQ